MKKAAAALAVLAAIGAAFVAMNRGVVVTVRNVGSASLSHVVVHVTGNSYQLGDIEPNGNRSVRVFSTGESHIEIEHSKGRLVVNTYFEGGYRGKISVDVTESEIRRIHNDVQVGVI